MGFLGTKIKNKRQGPDISFLHSLECKACPLNKNTRDLQSPHMQPTGAKQPLVYVLGEAPGMDEDLQGRQFVGVSGKLLRSKIPDEYEDKVRFNNVARTWPGKGNPTPDFTIIECCRPSVELDISQTRPKIIMGFGVVPLKWILHHRQVGRITDWRGRRMPVNILGHKCWFYPMLHPAYLLRRRFADSGSEEERMFTFDIKKAFKDLSNLPVPVVHTRKMAEENVKIFNGAGLDELEALLKKAGNQIEAGVDYETNAHRPYKKKSKILTVGVDTKDGAFSFAVDHSKTKWSDSERQHIKELWKKFVRSGVRKIAHNLPFEQEWTEVKVGEGSVRGGPWDCTLMQASTLDERIGEVKDNPNQKYKSKQGPLSLEFLVQQYFGFSIKGMYGLDRKNLDAEDIDKVMRYNAIDARYHRLLGKAQTERLKAEGLYEVYKQGRRRIPTCVLAQVAGLNIDQEETVRLTKKYRKVIRKAVDKIKALPIIKKFERQQGAEFNPASNPDLVYLFRDMLGFTQGEIEKRDKKKGTTRQTYSVDRNVLAKINHPVAKLVSIMRKAAKKESTYCYYNLPDRTMVWPDGLLHYILNPGFFTDTFRLSSNDPNAQNWPKREEEAKEIRKQIIAPEGHSIWAADQGQIEARVFAMAAKDEKYIKYLKAGHDIHMDWTHKVAAAYPRRIGGKRFLTDKDKLAKFRTDIKNQWTFPLFFGASINSVAGYLNVPVESIWNAYNEFKKEFMEIFSWQDTVVDFYHKHGYVEDLCGRRRHGPMTKSEAINMPIQSTACQIVMSGMNRLSELAFKTGDRYYQPRLQVHDELIFIWPNDKADKYLEKAVEIMVNTPFNFVNVPLTVEVAHGPNLLDMEKTCTVSSTGKWQWH